MLAFTSFIVNADRNILIFYPFLFFFLAVLAGNAEANVKLIQNSLLVSIFWGIFSAILALIGIHTIGSLSLIEKGMPFYLLLLVLVLQYKFMVLFVFVG